jgi:hypothetical protein
VERIIPDIRQRVELKLVGTPLTHQRFLRQASDMVERQLSRAAWRVVRPEMRAAPSEPVWGGPKTAGDLKACCTSKPR